MPSSSALGHKADAVKARLREAQDAHDRRPTRASVQRVASLRAKYMKLSRQYMAAARKGNPVAKKRKSKRRISAAPIMKVAREAGARKVRVMRNKAGKPTGVQFLR